MNKIENIEKQFETYCETLGCVKTTKVCDFEIIDNEATLTIYDLSYMEDEDNIKEDAISIFKENNIIPKSVEWDYDCGDEYRRECELQITF